MTKAQRIKSFLTGLIIIPIAIVAAWTPEDSYTVIMAVLSISLILSGLRSLGYYFTMARNMVGGKRMLYIGVIVLDFGIFTASITDIPRFYVMLYLLGIHTFAGFVEIFAATNAKKMGAVHWKMRFTQGVVNVIIGLVCLIFIGARTTAVYIYCAGIAYNGVMKIITAFRRTSMVYIQ
ncbi:MAG: DUF308 domain-containing protein [Firmicutes bacterium]|nr:DUF308 domain-containing protein [Bacillota bacterium]